MSQAIIAKGIASIFWSTPGLLGTPSAAIIESMTIKPAPTSINEKIPGNVGSTVTTVVLDDGFDAVVKCVYDGALTWPVFGATVVLKIPTQATGADQAAMATSLGAATGVNCLVTKPPKYDVDLARKKEAMITIELEFRPDLNL